MPKIWADTIESHRTQVHEAVLEATARLIGDRGPLSVTMSAIADAAGIGRATLYKYFPDVEAILRSWHTREVRANLERLSALADSDNLSLDDITDLVREQRAAHRAAGESHLIANLASSLASKRDTDRLEQAELITYVAGLLGRLAADKKIRTDIAVEPLAHWVLQAAHSPAELDDDTLAVLLSESLAPGRRGPRSPDQRLHDVPK